MTARIWAWLAVFLLSTGLDVVVDVVERIHVSGYHYHGINPRSFDILLGAVAVLGMIGLYVEFLNAWRTRVKLPTPVRTARRWR